MLLTIRILILMTILCCAYKVTLRHYNMFSCGILLREFLYDNDHSFYMNYGLWDDTTHSLDGANKNLVDLVFNKSDMLDKKNLTILDIGCGRGLHDIDLASKIDATCKITALDISVEQIFDALKKRSRVKFDICDADFIDLKYDGDTFDRIISIESAFQYKDRAVFFKNVNKLLEKDGKFIIADIMLNELYNENPITRLFLFIFADFLCIPEQNLISAVEWDKQLSSALDVHESIAVTNNTIEPYYKQLIATYVKTKGGPVWVGNAISKLLIHHQPFIYKIAICSKKT